MIAKIIDPNSNSKAHFTFSRGFYEVVSWSLELCLMFVEKISIVSKCWDACLKKLRLFF